MKARRSIIVKVRGGVGCKAHREGGSLDGRMGSQ